MRKMQCVYWAQTQLFFVNNSAHVFTRIWNSAYFFWVVSLCLFTVGCRDATCLYFVHNSANFLSWCMTFLTFSEIELEILRPNQESRLILELLACKSFSQFRSRILRILQYLHFKPQKTQNSAKTHKIWGRWRLCQCY